MTCIKVFKKSFDRCKAEIQTRLDKQERDKHTTSESQ